jgi:hypothetical protein
MATPNAIRSLHNSFALPNNVTINDSLFLNLPCASRAQFRYWPAFETLSSSGLGHRPFTAVTRVRIPLGSLGPCSRALWASDRERLREKALQTIKKGRLCAIFSTLSTRKREFTPTRLDSLEDSVPPPPSFSPSPDDCNADAPSGRKKANAWRARVGECWKTQSSQKQIQAVNAA